MDASTQQARSSVAGGAARGHGLVHSPDTAPPTRYVPWVYPHLHVAGLTLQSFGVCFALAFVVATLLLRRRLTELQRPGEWAYEIGLVAALGGFVGARVNFVWQNWGSLRGHGWSTALSGSGLVWFGGLLGGALAVFAWAAARRFLTVTLLDAAAPALAAGYVIGRLGCQLSGDGDYGKPSSLPWAMSYPHGTVPTTVRVHPAPVYEMLAMTLVAVVLWRRRRTLPPGKLFALYLVLAGTERVLVEFVRRNHPVVAHLTIPQLIGIGLIAVSLPYLAHPRTARATVRRTTSSDSDPQGCSPHDRRAQSRST